MRIMPMFVNILNLFTYLTHPSQIKCAQTADTDHADADAIFNGASLHIIVLFALHGYLAQFPA
jgi:hypothetical protein